MRNFLVVAWQLTKLNQSFLLDNDVPKMGTRCLLNDGEPCNFMRVISRKPLRAFAIRFPEARAELEAWFHEAEAAQWADPAQVKAKYGNASILKGGRVVFNICGNKYRLVVKINYEYAVVYVRFIGSHREYDRINAEMI